ncbi:MAG: fibrobacter succinogenes major paralogous domain-containing protein [Paludibacteraceae bacterium]|nr:fibrobacter succinogenes major paralogous domain-containing protein [Paludibacteraceae bacterium]
MKIPKLLYILLYTLLAGLFLTSCGLSSRVVGAGNYDSTSEVVDLGLSVKWAACNLGATKPEDYGNYYAWGETKPKATYTTDNSKWDDVAYDVLKSKGVINSRGNLMSKYDAATANWGAGWRMPTLDEIKELENRCRWSWTTMNGVKGYKVTGPSGKSIFLPAAGYHYGYGSVSHSVGSHGFYWSSTALDDSGYACGLYFYSDGYDWYGNTRGHGHSVRPVSE